MAVNPNEKIPVKTDNKIISGNARVRHEDNMLKSIFAEDLKSVARYAVEDVVVPGIKRVIAETLINGVNNLFYGHSSAKNRYSYDDRPSYRSYYDNKRSAIRRETKMTRRASDCKEIEFDTWDEAEKVLNQLVYLIHSQYKIARVADLYEFIGISGEYTDNNYGWVDLSDAVIKPYRDIYILSLPQPMEIN